MQDLQDIKNGIAISYDSDIQKSTKEDKRKRREAAKQKRIEKMEKEILKKDMAIWNYSNRTGRVSCLVMIV